MFDNSVMQRTWERAHASGLQMAPRGDRSTHSRAAPPFRWRWTGKEGSSETPWRSARTKPRPTLKGRVLHGCRLRLMRSGNSCGGWPCALASSELSQGQPCTQVAMRASNAWGGVSRAWTWEPGEGRDSSPLLSAHQTTSGYPFSIQCWAPSARKICMNWQDFRGD